MFANYEGEVVVLINLHESNFQFINKHYPEALLEYESVNGEKWGQGKAKDFSLLVAEDFTIHGLGE